MAKPLRILYAIGPEDVIEAYNFWIKGEDTPSQVSMPFSSQFYEVCKTLDAKGYVIAEATQPAIVRDERFIIEGRPVPLANARGVFYHGRQLLRGLQLLRVAISFQADVIIADSGTTYWFVLSLFSWLGIKVIPSLHCTLWRKYSGQTLGEKITLKLSRNLFKSGCHTIHAVSHDIAEQIAELTGGIHQPVYEFLPTYQRSDFASIAPPPKETSPFRVLFAGRVEYNKGVFDLLEIAAYFASGGIKDIIFDICGAGSALEALRQQAKQANLDEFFICHGYCNKPQMREMFGKSHAVIVPTRTDFIEGFNRVVSESILSGRPVITSAVCPALSYVLEAVIEVPPNDVTAYANAVLELYNNPHIYEQKRLATIKLQDQFYDINNSWGAMLKASLSTISHDKHN
jgi:glycogen(starch) synthase